MSPLRSERWVGCALALLAAGQLDLSADDAANTAKGRPTPIIFSAPKSDTVFSNLNQMGTKSSPLRDLESGLKKPFEIFDNARSPGFQPPSQFTPSTPPAPAINRKMKDSLEKRAEESYLLSEEEESQFSRDGLISPEREVIDPVTGRPKTSLDRYYDRIDRSRLGATNQTSGSLDFFGRKDEDTKSDLKPGKIGGFFDNELTPNAYLSGRTSNSISGGGGLPSEKLKSRSFGGSFELGPVEAGQPAGRTRETRLEEFKRLLDGPAYGNRNGLNATPSSATAYQLPKPTTIPTPGSSLSVGSQSRGNPFATATTPTPGFAGTVGVPNGLPEYTASSPGITTTPSVQQQPPAQQPPVPTFKIPRGRF